MAPASTPQRHLERILQLRHCRGLVDQPGRYAPYRSKRQEKESRHRRRAGGAQRRRLRLKGNNTNELWSYTSEGWLQQPDLPAAGKNVKNGGSLTAGMDLLYALKGNGTFEFYDFGPGVMSLTASVRDRVPGQDAMSGDVTPVGCRLSVLPNPAHGLDPGQLQPAPGRQCARQSLQRHRRPGSQHLRPAGSVPGTTPQLSMPVGSHLAYTYSSSTPAASRRPPSSSSSSRAAGLHAVKTAGLSPDRFLNPSSSQDLSVLLMRAQRRCHSPALS